MSANDSRSPERSPSKQKNSPEKRFSLFSPQSVSVIAESVGTAGLPDQVTSVLAEDTSYRLRELLQCCKEIMHHSQRWKLTAGDVNQALQWSDVSRISTPIQEKSVDYVYLKELDLFAPPDAVVDLTQEYSVFNEVEICTKPSVSVQWIQPEVAKEPNSQTSAAEETHLRVFQLFTKALLSSSPGQAEAALNALRENGNIGPVVPMLARLLLEMSSRTKENWSLALRILSAANALAQNPSLNIEPEVAVFVDTIANLLTNYPQNVSVEESSEVAQRLASCIAYILKRYTLDNPTLYSAFIQNTLGKVILNKEGTLHHQCRILSILRTISADTLCVIVQNQIQRLLSDLKDLQTWGEDTRFVEHILTLVVRDVLRASAAEDQNGLYEHASELLGPKLAIFCNSTPVEVAQEPSSTTVSNFNELYWLLKAKPTPKQKWRFSRAPAPLTRTRQNLNSVFDRTVLQSRHFNFRVRGLKPRSVQLLRKTILVAGPKESSRFCKLSLANLKTSGRLNPSRSKVFTSCDVVL